MSFATLGLAEPILRALRDTGYTTPTPIQAQAIPHGLSGRDLLGCAQTGTGKTAAFTLPILHRLAASLPPGGGRRPIRCLILSPTRELAAQIGESLATYGKHLPLAHAVIYGGVGQGAQEHALRRGVDLLVATPGRLLDLMGQNIVKLNHIDTFVLDEADRMLDMGFINDIRKVLKVLPTKRQTLFFSATMPKEIRVLADQILHDPATVEVAPVSSSAETVEQRVYFCEKPFKADLLQHVLADNNIYRCLVFTRTKHGADKVAKVLSKSGIPTDAIHGDKSQNQRLRALEAFKRGKVRVLVASDIAARGLDIDEIDLVVNFDVPNESETYVHRIGRTGRAGASGKAISFCSGEERPFLRDIEKLIRKPVPVEADHPWASRTAPPPPAGAPARGGRGSPAARSGSAAGNQRGTSAGGARRNQGDRPPRREGGGHSNPQRREGAGDRPAGDSRPGTPPSRRPRW